MVEIRRLEPSVKIRGIAGAKGRGRGRPPSPRTVAGGRPRQIMHVVRRRKDYPPPTPMPTPCVLWQGSVDPDGYGRFKTKRRGKWVTMKVHRRIMELYLGRTLTKTEFVLHLCDNPPCYRIDHLQIG